MTRSTSVFKGVERFADPRNPVIQILKSFLSQTLNIDFTRISIILAIFSFVSAAIPFASASGSRAYAWMQKFFMVSICVPGSDELYDQVLAWLSAHVLKQRSTRSLTAQTTIVRGGDGVHKGYAPVRGRRKVDTEYLPSFESLWFFYERRPFMIKLSRNTSILNRLYGNGRRRGRSKDSIKVTLTVSSLGRSQKAPKKFLAACREYSEKQQQSTVAVHTCAQFSYMNYGWELKAHRAARHLETVHLDEGVKSDLVSDLEQYLDPKTRQYYNSLNIPYRRGYLLHGPPGTGKTSLSVALAGEFGLDLFILDLSVIPSDDILDTLFQELPSPCLVLLEDIDVVGLKDRNVNDEEKKTRRRPYVQCTLSGLLNALDGVASSEGRILLITTNMPDRLDEALLRPGRIDRKIYFGHVNQHGAEQMFRRMFDEDPSVEHSTVEDRSVESLDSVQDSLSTKVVEEYEDVAALAKEFSKRIPQETFTPAQLQEYLLQHQKSPVHAVEKAADWVAEEVRKMEEKASIAEKNVTSDGKES
ncbi:P-loop containing nucleoside triphosphate hydrolase protein [Jackrogersella minutella]|nr:P-loop containing nucleoside triphosphate hydrolase protein [Jackrogersella minutella]